MPIFCCTCVRWNMLSIWLASVAAATAVAAVDWALTLWFFVCVWWWQWLDNNNTHRIVWMCVCDHNFIFGRKWFNLKWITTCIHLYRIRMRRLVFTVVWVLLLLFNETKVIYAITKIKPPCTHCIHADECFVFFIVQLTRIALHQRVQFTLHCSVYLLWARAVDIFLFVVNTNGYRNLFPHLQIRSYRSVF